MNSARNYHAGLLAEASVLRHFTQAGYSVLARRFRGARGEIDLIVSRDALIVFVEVKKSSSFEAALARMTPAQTRRIFQTAEEFLARQNLSTLSDTRFDIALVNVTGQVEVMEGVFGP